MKISFVKFFLIPFIIIVSIVSYSDEISYPRKLEIKCDLYDQYNVRIQVQEHEQIIDKILQPIEDHFYEPQTSRLFGSFYELASIYKYKHNSIESSIEEIMNRYGITDEYKMNIEKIIREYSGDFHVPPYFAIEAFTNSLEHKANDFDIFNRQFWIKTYDLGKVVSVRKDAEKRLRNFDNRKNLSTFEQYIESAGRIQELRKEMKDASEDIIHFVNETEKNYRKWRYNSDIFKAFAEANLLSKCEPFKNRYESLSKELLDEIKGLEKFIQEKDE